MKKFSMKKMNSVIEESYEEAIQSSKYMRILVFSF